MKGVNILVLSIQDYKIHGFYDSSTLGKGVRILIDESKLNFKKELFEDLLGEEFGKKDFYYEPNSWEKMVDAIENKLKEVLETMKKVPEEHQEDPVKYIRAYKEQDYRGLFYEDVEEFLGQWYHINSKNESDTNLYYFQLFYKTLKRIYEEGHPLYISVATVEDQKKYP